MKIAEKIRTRDSYMEKIKIKSKVFVHSTNITINSFESFLTEKYGANLDSVLVEILELDDEQRIDTI